MLPAESVASGWMLPATEHLRGADGEADQHVDAKRTGDGADGTVCAQQQVGALGDPGRICCGRRLSSQARDPIVGGPAKEGGAGAAGPPPLRQCGPRSADRSVGGFGPGLLETPQAARGRPASRARAARLAIDAEVRRLLLEISPAS